MVSEESAVHLDIDVDRREVQVARTLSAPKKGLSIDARLDTHPSKRRMMLVVSIRLKTTPRHRRT